MRSGPSTLALLLAATSIASAQRLSGTVRSADNAMPISGAVVTTLDSAGRTLSRALSNGTGRYALPLDDRAARLRVVKIGFRPRLIELQRVAGDMTVEITLQRAPVILETMRITSDASCAVSADASLVRDIWEQAKSALLAAIVARDASPARVQLLAYQRRLDVTPRVITEQQIATTTGMSTRPMAAARTGAELAATGYLSRDRGGNSYFAPDADVLFDDSFTDAHCFGLTRGTRDRSGQVGLTFRPRETKQDFVDVEGTLWLRAQATELVQLDYSYTNIPPEASRAGARGTMHFRTMPNGVVIIDSWSILVPVMIEVRRIVGTGSPMRAVVHDLVETGGYVLDAAWSDGTHWSDPLGGVRGHVREETTAAPLSGLRVVTLGASRETDAEGAYALTPFPPGHYTVAVEDTAYSNYVKTRRQSREVTVGRHDTVTADFEVPSRQSIVADLCRGSHSSGTTLLGAIRGGHDLPDELSVHGSWFTSNGGSSNVVLDKLRKNEQNADVSASGHFIICGLPALGSWVTLSLTLGRIPIADTAIAPNSTDAPTAINTRRLEWTLPAGALEAALRRDAASLSGRVISNGNPVAGAEVWVVSVDTTVTTDSIGRFRVGGLGAGPQLIQIRKVGFPIKRDSVLLKAHDETIKNFVLDGARPPESPFAHDATPIPSRTGTALRRSDRVP